MGALSGSNCCLPETRWPEYGVVVVGVVGVVAVDSIHNSDRINCHHNCRGKDSIVPYTYGDVMRDLKQHLGTRAPHAILSPLRSKTHGKAHVSNPTQEFPGTMYGLTQFVASWIRSRC